MLGCDKYGRPKLEKNKLINMLITPSAQLFTPTEYGVGVGDVSPALLLTLHDIHTFIVPAGSQSLVTMD